MSGPVLTFNPFTRKFDFIGGSSGGGGGPATQAPKLIETFGSDAGTVSKNFVRLSAPDTVTAITDNSSAQIPNGIFGICYLKNSPTLAEVIFEGILGGYSGLTPGLPVFVGTDGLWTHTPPSTGMIQQIGFSITTSEIYFNLQQPIRRS